MRIFISIAAITLFASLMFTGCVFSPGPPGYGVDVVPPLPPIVELGAEQYYYQNGYHYFYQDERWHYAKEKNGPRTELPRSHWPKEIRHKEREEHGDEIRREHEGVKHQ